MKTIYQLLFLSMLLGCHVFNAFGQVTYVNHAATGSNNGTSWANAYTSLRTAINVTSSGEIWVAQGTYYPATAANPNRSLSFTLKNNVAIYGGFIGTETTRSQRDYENNPTIMSGDIGVANDTSDNSYHVIYVNGSGTAINSSAVLDGFTIKHGNVNDGSGGGLALDNSCSPSISNCKFTENYANNGGGVYCYINSNPVFTNVSFTGNFGFFYGGAVFALASEGITFKNCLFQDNEVELSGGALCLFSSVASVGTTVIDSCTFIDNDAFQKGGAIYGGGDVIINKCNFEGNNVTSTSHAEGGAINNEGDYTIINSIFRFNSSRQYGGAISNKGNLNIYNSSFYYNYLRFTSTGNTFNNLHSGGVSNDGGNVIAKNSILYYNIIFEGISAIHINNYGELNGGTSTIDYCIGQGLPSSPNNYDVDPLFISTSILRLQSTSPAINAGDNSAVPAGITTDIEGNDRIFGGTVDIGAYEFGACNYVINNRIYVDADKTTGANDGLAWSSAFQNLQAAIAFSKTCDAVQEIWVADGTYKPTSGTDRAIAFELKNGLTIYGGFVGNETSLSQRDFQTNLSILDGDIGTISDNTDNSYHVVTSIGNDNTAILDGFTIKNGNANLSSNDYNAGAGLYSDGTSAVIKNCTFTANAATLGAGVYQKNTGSSTFINCIFHANTSFGFGSGGGGAYIREATPTFTNCLFYENSCFNGAGIYNLNTQITITNVTFADNSAGHGSGIYSLDNIAERYTVINCIFWNPLAISEINRTAFNVTYSTVRGGYNGTGNLDEDPLFVSTANHNYALQASSPAIDAGNNAAIPSGITTDLAGFDRIINGTVNMGAFETSNSVLPVELLYFRGEVVEDGNLLTWETASEVNNKGFEVQYSTDGYNWLEIGFVQGNGTTLENQSYEFTDELNLTGFQNRQGLYYYRLKQLDFDDRYEYSNVIILTNQFNGHQQQLTLYPNPVRQELHLANSPQGNLLIYNSLGQPVRQLRVNRSQMSIDTSDLPNGIYTLKLQTTNGTLIVKQFIKL